MSGHGMIIKYKPSNSTSTSLSFKTHNILGMQRKEGKSDFARGYNAAIEKCEKRVDFLIKQMYNAYLESIQTDEDSYEY
jgi:hypothetical protein